MPKTLEKPNVMDHFFKDLIGLLEVREIDRQGKAKTLFFKGLEHFKTYTPPTDKNVYFGVFSRSNAKGSKENCLHTNVLWADYDYMNLAEVKERIISAGLPSPSIFVNSGNGIHSYWLLDKKAREGVEDVLKGIAERTGGDMKVTEIARIMRLPNTNNMKGDSPKRCEVIEQNNNRYSLDMFKSILQVEQQPKEQSKEPNDISELQATTMACIPLIAKGVRKGQRNFALGKITAFMKQQGFSRKKSFEIVKRWNENNTPAKPKYELQDQFNRFWESDYTYLGCKFRKSYLEEVNKQLCPMGECKFHAKQSVQIIDGESTVAMDNEIFKQKVYEKVKGLEIACYSVITREKEITREQLSKYVNRHVKNTNFIKAIKGLKAKGMIEIKPAIKKSGIPETIILKSKSNYGRGYTLVPNLLTKLYTKKAISENAYKLMVLLKYYSFGKSVVYPTVQTMSEMLDISEQWVTELLKWLDEQEGLIKRNYSSLDNGKTKLLITLLY